MKILHVAETAKFGIGTYLKTLASGLADDGDVQLLVAPREHEEHFAGIRAELALFRRSSRSIGTLIDLSRAVLEAQKAFEPQIIHAHSSLAGFVVRMQAALGLIRCPIVYSPHGWAFQANPTAFGCRLIAAVERMLAIFCVKIIAVSEFERALAIRLGFPAAQLNLVYSGLLELQPDDLPQTGGRLKVLFVGRTDFLKGVDLLLDAARSLQSTVSVQIVGDAFLGDYVINEAPENVVYLGLKSPSEVHRLMSASDVIVVPSRYEAFGLVALEAMRASRPVIASAVGGLVEIVVDGETGRLVEPGSAQALANALIWMGSADRETIGSAGRARYLKLFTAERMTREIRDIYRSSSNAPFQPN